MFNLYLKMQDSPCCLSFACFLRTDPDIGFVHSGAGIVLGLHLPIFVHNITGTVHYNIVKNSTVQNSTVQNSTVQYRTVQYSTVKHRTVEYSKTQYSTVKHSTVQYNKVKHRTILIQYSTVRYCILVYKVQKTGEEKTKRSISIEVKIKY